MPVPQWKNVHGSDKEGILMLHEKYYMELKKQEELLNRKNEKSDFYNGVFDRYKYPVLTQEQIFGFGSYKTVW